MALDNLSKIGLDENRIKEITEYEIILKPLEGEIDTETPAKIKFDPNSVYARIGTDSIYLLRDGEILNKISDIYLKESALKKATKEIEARTNKKFEKSTPKEAGYKISEIYVSNIHAEYDTITPYFVIDYSILLKKEVYGGGTDEILWKAGCTISPDGSIDIPDWVEKYL